MRFFRIIVLLLVIVGGINWGLWGLFQYDLVQDYIAPYGEGLAKFIYILIGLAGIYAISFLFSKGTCGFGCDEDSSSCEQK